MISAVKQKKIENPFYGKKALLTLNSVGTNENSTQGSVENALNAAWNEVKDDKQLRQAFFVLMFSFGDITNRQHNTFKKAKVDGGGNSNRNVFRYCMNWLLQTNKKQYLKFLSADLFRQFVCLWNVLATQVRTKPGTKTVTEVITAYSENDITPIAEYLATIIRTGSAVDNTLIAKWLVRPRLSKRQRVNRKTGVREGTRKLTQKVTTNMRLREKLYIELSTIMGWEMIKHPHNMEFVGMYEWRKQHNQELESVLFSSGEIRKMKKLDFLTFLERLPSGARYRVRRRLLDKDDKQKNSKWGNSMHKWFLEWEKSKEVAQVQQRELTEKVRQGTATEEDLIVLQDVKKKAKVNTGADSLLAVFEKNDPLAVQSVMDKITFDVPVLVVADCSGSMGGKPIYYARLLTTLAMLKNPSKDLADLLVCFGSTTTMYSGMGSNTVSDQSNRFMQGKAVQVQGIVDRTKPFVDNFNSVSRFVTSSMGGTYFNTVAAGMKAWVDKASDAAEKLIRIETIQQYPVFVVVSDGDMNSSSTAAQSMNDFTMNMKQWFNWEGVVVVWDVNTGYSGGGNKFESCENVIYYNGINASIINNIFTKISDLDVVDVYTGIKSMFESNRYDLIKKNTL